MTLTGMKYICSAGQSFDSVALILFKNEKYAADLMCANPAYVNKLVFVGGEVLEIPEVAAENGADEGFAPIKAPWKE